jgi:hypothetical protein
MLTLLTRGGSRKEQDDGWPKLLRRLAACPRLFAHAMVQNHRLGGHTRGSQRVFGNKRAVGNLASSASALFERLKVEHPYLPAPQLD